MITRLVSLSRDSIHLGALMPMVKRGCVVLLVISVSACGGGNSTTASSPLTFLPPTSPSPTSPPPTPTPTPPVLGPNPIRTFHLTGIATDDNGSPVTGATVTVHPYVYDHDGRTSVAVSGVTDGAGFYRIDFDAQTNTDPANLVIAYMEAESPGHEKTGNYVSRSATGSETVSQNLHLYEIKRITAGESTFLTVELDDTVLCFEGDFVCRTVHIVVPKDGRMSVEAVPTSSAANAGLEIDGQRGSCLPSGCSLTASMQVTAGQEVVAKIGIKEGSTASQSFVLKTSLGR